MDKTEQTIQTYNQCALAFQKKFMDLKLYKESFAYLSKFIKPNSHILDLGCGPGNVAKYFIDKDKTLKIHGVDLSEEMIHLARNNVPEALFEVNDIRKIDYQREEFDIIIAAFCLPFLYNKEAIDFINKISDYTKQNGIIYLSTMEGSGHGFEKAGFSGESEMFFNYYSEEFLEKIFQKNNLKIDKYIKQDYHNQDGSILQDMIYILRK